MSEFESAYAPPTAVVADREAPAAGDGTPLGAFRSGEWAPFWHRVAAAIIDGLVLAVPSWIVTLIFAFAVARTGRFGVMLAAELLPAYTLGWIYQGWLLSARGSATLGPYL